MPNEEKSVSDADVVRTIIRAWKDDEFRQSLPPDMQALVPQNPAGVIDLIAAELTVDPRIERLNLTLATACSEGWRCLSVSKC